MDSNHGEMEVVPENFGMRSEHHQYICKTANPLANKHEELFRWPNGKYERAIRHEHLRSQLLHEAEKIGSWTHHQPHGAAANDRTAPVAYPPDQLTWGFASRDQYPPINFVLDRKDYTHPNYEVTAWRYNGYLVLDLSRKPIRNFRHLPYTISSRIPGGHIEALMRFDDRVDYADIRARMPPTVTVSQNGKAVEKPLKHVRALSAATQKYREMAGCPSWYDEPEGEALNNYVKSILPKDCFAMNSTRSFRNLSQDEINALQKNTTASGSKKSKKRLPPDVHEKQGESSKKPKATANGDKALRNGSMTERRNAEQQIQAGPTTADTEAEKAPADPLDDRDSRDLRPLSLEELEELGKALLPTVTQVNSVLGFDAPTFEYKSYADQLDNLQSFVKQTLRVFHGDDDPPTLIHLTKWTGGILHWRSSNFSDGKKLYEINDQGGVGAEISLVDDPVPSKCGPQNDTAEEPLPGAAVADNNPIDAHTPAAADDSDYDDPIVYPVQGSYIVDENGYRIRPNARPRHPPPPTIYEDPPSDADESDGDAAPTARLSSSRTTVSDFNPGRRFDFDRDADKENIYAGNQQLITARLRLQAQRRRGPVANPEILEESE
ncbi:MAG: hypothetical protein Q9184_005622 [Pyrenodesmia sp. 2 TL-2023]